MLLRQIDSIEELKEIATEINALLEHKSVILMSGKLGAGKTTLTKELLAQRGIEKKTVKSPTYTIKRTYKTPNETIHHIDLYRIDKVDTDELMDEEGIYIIEWADKLSEPIKEPAIKIHIDINQDESRTIKIENEEVQ